MRTHLSLLAIVLVLSLALSGCGGPGALPAATPSAGPEAAAEAFYHWYMAYPGNPLVDRAYQANQYVAPELAMHVDQLLNSFHEGGFDPFLCAQDIPGTIAVTEAVVTGEEAAVVVHTIWNQGTPQQLVQNVNVTLRWTDDMWKLVAVDCSPLQGAQQPQPPAGQEAEILPTAAPTAGATPASAGLVGEWQTLRDDQYGFEIRYPGDWTVLEVAILDPAVEAPIVRVVTLLPQPWAEQMPAPGTPPDPTAPNIIAPLSVEVSVGTMEEYRRMYPELESSETLQVNGLPVTLEQQVTGDYREIRYLFQHPSDPTLRVTVRDQISGFSDRAQENEEVVAVVGQVVERFSFVR